MNDLDEALATAKWKRSMRGNEHWYVTSKDYPDLVKQVQEKIRVEGERRRYRHYSVYYWFHNGYRYWVMPGVGPTTIKILNRTKIRPKYREQLG